MSYSALRTLMRMIVLYTHLWKRSDVTLWRCLRQLLSGHCWSYLPHPTHEQCMALRVVTPRILLCPQWFFYIPIRVGTAISMWSSKPCEGLTIFRYLCKGSIFILSYFKTLMLVWPGFEPVTFHSADLHSINWANQVPWAKVGEFMPELIITCNWEKKQIRLCGGSNPLLHFTLL